MNKKISGQYRTRDARMLAFQRHMEEVMPLHDVRVEFPWLIDLGYFTAPASSKYHGAYEGGLYDHSELVALTLTDLTKRLDLKWEREESPYLIGFLHDICKADAYRKTESGFEYNPDMILTGHGEKSVIITLQHIQLTDEEIMCIRYHMGAYEGEKIWNNLGKAIQKYPNILWTHTADMLALQVLEV